MSSPEPPTGGRAALALRPMHVSDIPQVVVIEADSFSAGWPRTAYERELTMNQTAHYLVLEEFDAATPRIVGYAGMWCLLDEAHVVTVAVAPVERGRGLGKLLVHGLVDRAVELGMTVATLECRVSNDVARALYRDYGFYEVGTRKAYYSDNHEDAVIMTTEELTSAPYRERLARLEQALAGRFPGVVPRLAGAHV